MTDAVTLFLSMLAVLCQVFVAGVLIFRLSTLGRGRRYRWARFRSALSPYAAPLAFAVATVTTAGSLYMSEIAGYTPCMLCWIQRGFIYPLVIATALVWWRPTWRWARALAIVLAIGDIPVSLYHYLVERVPSLGETSCSTDNPCTQIWFESFGYITLPMMAMTAAATVLVLLLTSWPDRSGE